MIATERKMRVLAVDDSEDILELIRINLGDDYDVATLSDPVDVYEVMDIFEPDLLLLDVMMPRINGFQLIEMLRRKPATKDLPIIVLSAKSSPGEIKHGYRLGATMYLTKPFQAPRLRKNLETQARFNAKDVEKTYEGDDLARQLELTPASRRKHLKVSEGLKRKEQSYFSPRERATERIRSSESRENNRWQG